MLFMGIFMVAIILSIIYDAFFGDNTTDACDKGTEGMKLWLFWAITLSWV
jgi:hypothetical protein